MMTRKKRNPAVGIDGASRDGVLARNRITNSNPAANCNREQRRRSRPSWETLRRLRYGDLTRLFRHRYGPTLPDDDAGIEDLWLLLQNVSLAPFGAEKKMRHVCALLAPWLSEEGVQERIDFLTRLPAFERNPSAHELGERLRVTNSEREL